MKFNINGYMKVKLTDLGIKILEEEHNYNQGFLLEENRRPFKLNLTDDGWYREQAWCLFQIFGPYIKMSGEHPFETEVDIEC